jgi:hypothetical protein
MLDRGRTPEEFGLAGYVRAVAAAVGVPMDAAGWEVGDSPAAYLALGDRGSDREFMLIWSARSGSKVCAENTEWQPATVVARFGAHVVPAPGVVQDFVADVLTGHRRGGTSARPVARLAELLARYAIASWELPGLR